MSGELPRHEPLPHLFDVLTAPFEPTPAQRRTGRFLLALLRVPGTLGLLKAFHARRGRGH